MHKNNPLDSMNTGDIFSGYNKDNYLSYLLLPYNYKPFINSLVIYQVA